MTTPLLLALDTCTDLASIALYDGEQVLSEMTWHSNRRHTVELLPQVVAMLTQAFQHARRRGVRGWLRRVRSRAARGSRGPERGSARSAARR